MAEEHPDTKRRISVYINIYNIDIKRYTTNFTTNYTFSWMCMNQRTALATNAVNKFNY